MTNVIKTNTKFMGKQMKLGQMISIRMYNDEAKKFETAFLIKDSKSKIKKILNSMTGANRSHIGKYGNAAAFVFLIGFGKENEYLYDYWFNYHIQSGNTYELLDLVQRDKIPCIFINEKNNTEETALIPNTLRQDMLDYISIAQDTHWTDSEFNELKETAIKHFKSIQGIWDNGCVSA